MSDHQLNSTFINPDSFATYAAIGFTIIASLLLGHYGEAMRTAAGNRRLQIAYFIEHTAGRGAVLLAGAFVILVALLLTGSRGGVFASAFGLFVIGTLGRRRREQDKPPILLLAIGVIFVAATLLAFGGSIGGKLEKSGIYDESRLSVYLLTIRSIFNEPLLGYGYGTFADVFPMYRDHSIGVLGTWTEAHDTYLEIFQGLGLVFGSMLIGCIIALVIICLKGAVTRQRDATAPVIAVGAAAIVATHAVVDFSLQIQAVAVTFMAVLGTGAAQSASKRLVLTD